MRRIVYTICLKGGVEIESTFSYRRALTSLDLGCYFTTRIVDCPNKLSKKEQEKVPNRNTDLLFKKHIVSTLPSF